MGNGLRTLFCEDFWIGESRLRDAFPRLYSVPVQKEKVIADSGFWDGRMWIWSFQRRRSSFEWEPHQLNALHHIIDQVSLQRELPDEVVWKYDNKSGVFSVKSHLKTAYTSNSSNVKVISYNFVKGVSRGLVSPS